MAELNTYMKVMAPGGASARRAASFSGSGLNEAVGG